MKLYILALVLAGAGVSPQAGAASFTPLGVLPGSCCTSQAFDVSADGRVVVGNSNSPPPATATPARWSGGSIYTLGDLPGGSNYGSAWGVSRDGLVIVGQASSTSGLQAFRWTADGGIVGLGYLPDGDAYSVARDVSADGSVVVGSSDTASGFQAFRWTAGGDMIGLEHPSNVANSTARAVSAEGSAVVGQMEIPASGQEATQRYSAFRWTADGGMVDLGDLSGGLNTSGAFGVSADGSIVVGQGTSALGSEAMRWTSDGGMEGLGDLPGGAFQSYARDVSADGSVVVGRANSALGAEAFIWDETNGIQNLSDVLMDGGADLVGWTLIEAVGMTDDGSVIVGYGENPSGFLEGWTANMSEVPIPAAAWLFGSALLGLGALKRKKA